MNSQGSQEEEEMSQQYVSTNVDEPLMLNFETCETVDKSIAHLECELNAGNF
ncbi:unnamed protein product [Toxocara canis]|uniref:Uncharacterized protein n=1 Tax=Toxocara canis TaxID=6265 RepID=A0A183U8E4_TOXCA|nr:unnamed protein product [Toxocara canis]